MPPKKMDDLPLNRQVALQVAKLVGKMAEHESLIGDPGIAPRMLDYYYNLKAEANAAAFRAPREQSEEHASEERPAQSSNRPVQSSKRPASQTVQRAAPSSVQRVPKAAAAKPDQAAPSTKDPSATTPLAKKNITPAATSEDPSATTPLPNKKKGGKPPPIDLKDNVAVEDSVPGSSHGGPDTKATGKKRGASEGRPHRSTASRINKYGFDDKKQKVEDGGGKQKVEGAGGRDEYEVELDESEKEEEVEEVFSIGSDAEEHGMINEANPDDPDDSEEDNAEQDAAQAQLASISQLPPHVYLPDYDVLPAGDYEFYKKKPSVVASLTVPEQTEYELRMNEEEKKGSSSSSSSSSSSG